jgi:hypothetical protein
VLKNTTKNMSAAIVMMIPPALVKTAENCQSA